MKNLVSSGASSASLQCVNGIVKPGDNMATVRQKCGYPVATANDQQLANSQAFQASGDTQQREQRFNTLNLLPSYGKWKPKQQSSADTEARRPHKFTVLIYQPESYMPKTAFMFIDNKLTQAGRVADDQ